MAGNNEYNQFAPQKSPAGDQATNFMHVQYPDSVPDEMPMADLNTKMSKDGWDIWTQCKTPM